MNWQVIKEIIADIYSYEGDVIFSARQENFKVIRPSSVLLILIGIFYCLSPVDLVSEAVVVPKFMGYVDDIIICLLIGACVYSDVKGVFKFDEEIGQDTESEVLDREVSSQSDDNGQDNVLHKDRPICDNSNNEHTNASDGIVDCEEFSTPPIGTDSLNSNDNDDSNDESFEGGYNYEDNDYEKLLR